MSELGIWLKTLMQLNQKQNGNKTMANQMQKKKKHQPKHYFTPSLGYFWFSDIISV